MRKNRYKRTHKKENPPLILREVGRISLRMFSMFLVCAVMGAMLIFGYNLLTQCSYFFANRVEVNGNMRLTEMEVLECAEIEKGVNIISVNLSAVRKKLMANPWIHQADIYLELPDTITIEIVEERPLAVLDLGREFLINHQGDVFKEAERLEKGDLPVIVGLDYTDWKTKECPNPKIFSSVMDVLWKGRSAISVLPNTAISRIVVDREMGLTLETKMKAHAIHLGFNDYNKKYQSVIKILSYLNQNATSPNVGAIDLRNPDRIVAKLVDEAESGRG